MDRTVYPPEWNEKRVQDLIAYYDNQSEDEVAAALETAFDAQEAGELSSEAVYRAVITEGLEGLPTTSLAEIADFIYFKRQKILRPHHVEDELHRALTRAEHH